MPGLRDRWRWIVGRSSCSWVQCVFFIFTSLQGCLLHLHFTSGLSCCYSSDCLDCSVSILWAWKIRSLFYKTVILDMVQLKFNKGVWNLKFNKFKIYLCVFFIFTSGLSCCYSSDCLDCSVSILWAWKIRSLFYKTVILDMVQLKFNKGVWNLKFNKFKIYLY